MQLIAAFHQGLHCKVKKDLQTTQNTIFLENYNLTTLEMYNGLFFIVPNQKKESQ